eukprot:m.321070 g.321070  ORF g.321070 m.321070 type:complete len:77 (+) comp16525_c0_seq1:635-865(+)
MNIVGNETSMLWITLLMGLLEDIPELVLDVAYVTRAKTFVKRNQIGCSSTCTVHYFSLTNCCTLGAIVDRVLFHLE